MPVILGEKTSTGPYFIDTERMNVLLYLGIFFNCSVSGWKKSYKVICISDRLPNENNSFYYTHKVWNTREYSKPEPVL